MTYPIDKVQFDIKRGLPQGDPATEPPGHGASRMGMWRNRANIRAPDVTETKETPHDIEIASTA